MPIKKEIDNAKAITYKLKFIDKLYIHEESLSKHVDNLSEIYKKECKVCMEKRKIRSECDFIGLAYNKFHYKCKECKRRCLISINGLIKKFPSVYQW